MKALVVGLGGIGTRHARALRQADPSLKLAGCRTRAKTAADLGDATTLFDHIDHDLGAALAWKPDVAVVATPTSLHLDIVKRLVAAGVHVLVEKPLADSLDGVDTVIDECRVRGLTFMVGYNLRFDAGLQAVHRAVTSGSIGRVLSMRAEVGQFLPSWRPGRDYRQTCSARADLGGGALFELSHELDYTRWIGGEVVRTMATVRSVGDLGIDADDTADLLVDFENGGIGAIHLDMLDRLATRRCRVVGTEGTVTWDGITGQADVFDATTENWRPLTPGVPGRLAATYIRQAEHFLACASTGAPATVDGRDGAATVRLALAARRSASTGVAQAP